MTWQARVSVLAVLVSGVVGAAQETALTTVRVTDGVRTPVYVTHVPNDYARVFIVSQRGTIHILKAGDLLPTPFLDVSAISDCCSERGLLGLAFHPNYASNGAFFVNYSDNRGDTVVARYRVSDDPDVADPTGEILLTISQTDSNHNGGWIDFGFDGYLYIATGDGGGSWDPNNAGQTNVGELLGNILRIDVAGDDWPLDDTRNYAIPPDNPFVDRAGEDEIWAYGLRNPWRNAFDQRTGELYIADVGQGTWEEINVEPADHAGGSNYGWRCKEASDCTGRSGCSCEDTSLVGPVHEYRHGGLPFRCSITGGEVYRGCAIPDLQGTYFFADYCSDQIWSFRYVGGVVTDFRDRTVELDPGGAQSITGISSFGRDAAGELYICDLGGEVFKIVQVDALPSVGFVASEPPSGAIDARQPSEADGSNPTGWQSIVLEFDGAVPSLQPDDFNVEELGGEDVAPSVEEVVRVAANRLRITFNRFITAGAWTTVFHCETGTYVRLGYLPADVNGDGVSTATDVLELIDALNGVGVVRPEWSLDIDRSGAAGASDVLQIIDLLSGAGDFPPYNLVNLP